MITRKQWEAMAEAADESARKLNEARARMRAAHTPQEYLVGEDTAIYIARTLARMCEAAAKYAEHE